MLRTFPRELETYRRQIEETARQVGLDFYEVIFEMIDFDQMSQMAAYGGFPQRYPHWRFGMEYEKLRKQHSYGLGKIYEMVINNDPCYAYLLTDNELVDQKLVMSHVYGHCDFFKNNIWFSKTSRKMMDGMANHATRVWRHIERHGHDAVEKFLDVCLTLENLVDPYSPFMKREPEKVWQRADAPRAEPPPENLTRFPAKRYMERYINPPEELEAERKRDKATAEAERRAFPPTPQRDVLLFLLQYAPLEDWQADILDLIRDEAYYFAPQGMTKIMNEGWATYWHSHLMTRYHLRDAELVTYCDHHSGTLATTPGQLNPYKLGLELLRDIEQRWNTGRFGKEYEDCQSIEQRRKWDMKLGKGREKIFEVRRVHNDVTFIDEFLTEEFCERHKLFHYRADPATGRMVSTSGEFEKVKQQLLFMLTNHAQPYIYVVDGNYANRGELYLAHKHLGVDLDLKYAAECLANMQKIWQRPVRLQAMIDEDMLLLTHDGRQLGQQKIKDDSPKPAHMTIV